GSLRVPGLWPAVARAAARPGSARHAERAIAAGGPAALAALAPLVVAGWLEGAALVAVARACGRVGGEEAQSLLEALRGSPVGAVRHAALEALAQGWGGAAAGEAGNEAGNEVARARAELEVSALRGRRLAEAVALLPLGPEAALLVGALRDAGRASATRPCCWRPRWGRAPPSSTRGRRSRGPAPCRSPGRSRRWR